MYLSSLKVFCLTLARVSGKNVEKNIGCIELSKSKTAELVEIQRFFGAP